MKKLLLIFLALSLFLCSCELARDLGFDFDFDFGADSDTVIDAGNDTDANKDKPKTYEDVERRKATGYKNNYYSFKNDSNLLKLRFPAEWSVSEADEGYDIIRDGENVGHILGALADDISSWTAKKTESHSVDDIRVTKYIEQKGNDEVFRYRYVYKYSTNGQTHIVTLTANLSEIDASSEEKLYNEVDTVKKIRGGTVGVFSEELGEPSSILILGNSFINSSNIGAILSEMLENNGKECNVEAISRGYASVATYINDSMLMDQIRQGRYDVVFICGFYDMPEIQNLGVLKSACDRSDTKLVIFPAHNENTGVLSSAKKEYPSLFCLDWRAEIEYLIQRCGVDKWDMCINDMHLHSTPLAGYVGAHMIYRAIYGELPTRPIQDSINQSYVDSLLGDYAYVGDGRVFQEDNTTYLG